MNEQELKNKLQELINLPHEIECVEFKKAKNNYDFDDIGRYFSAISNEANLKGVSYGWLIFGITDKEKQIVGTNYRQNKEGLEKLKKEIADQTNHRITFREIYELHLPEGRVLMFQIPAAPPGIPATWRSRCYGREGESIDTLSVQEFEEIRCQTKEDWSAGICEKAAINDLDPEAIHKARLEYKNRYPDISSKIESWDKPTFLNKAKLTIQNRITRTAIILLGKDESEHFLSPSVAKISWILKNDKNNELGNQLFGPPFLMNVDRVFLMIRNLQYRYLPDGTLFPIEINKYDSWVIRESLHNCIAHQDYELKGRINVVEAPDEIIFSNVGNFIPGSVEKVIQQDSPPEIYRNSFLAQAMFNLRMIETRGGGIKKMFRTQIERFFPLPDYDLSCSDRVVVKITGRILNDNYTRLLIKNPEMDLQTVIILDKVQKRKLVSKEEHKILKSKKLVEGRYPNIFLSSKLATTTDEKTKYIKYKAFDDRHYKDMIIAYIKKYGSAGRKDIDKLLTDKLSDALDKSQKRNKISNLLRAMSKKDKTIKNKGTTRKPIWIINPQNP